MPSFLGSANNPPDRLFLGSGSAAAPAFTFGAATDSGLYKSGTSEMSLAITGSQFLYFGKTGSTYYFGTDNAKIWASDGTAGAPSLSFASDTDTGFYRTGSNGVGVALGGTVIFDFNTTVNRSMVTFQPASDNAFTLGGPSSRWTTVYATTGTINTSHSSTKSNIVDLDISDLEIPRGVEYDRDGRRYIGYLNDNLPDLARPFNEDGTINPRDNYENAVIGILCAAVRNLQNEVASLKDQLQSK